MALTRLDNLYSSKTGKYLYVSPDDFNATDELDNRGNSPLRPFKTIQRAFIEVARYSFLPATGGESVPDRFDQFSIMLMPGDHYIDNRPGLATLTSAGNEYQRYYNAKELIVANRQEIIDRSFAEIAVQYDEVEWGTDWVVPGDPAVDDQNRFYDAYRLIQRNKEYIQARAVGQLSIDYLEGQTTGIFANDWVIPMDSALGTDNFNRRASAYRLILKNKQDIVDETWNAMIVEFPEVLDTLTKCKRDIGYWVEHLALDVLYGGSRFTQLFTRTYFNEAGTEILAYALDESSDQNVGDQAELNATIYAMSFAKQLAKIAVQNPRVDQGYPASQTISNTQYFPGTPNKTVDVTGWYSDSEITTDPSQSENYGANNCATIQTTLDTLLTLLGDCLVAENTSSLDSLPADSTNFDIGIGTSKCYRDVGFYIDAISLDVVQGGGNRYTRKYIQNYFNQSGTAWVDDGLQGEEQQSKIVFDQAVVLMKEAISNQLGYKDLTLTHDTTDSGLYNGNTYDPNSCANVKSQIDTLAALIETYFLQGTLENFVEETAADNEPGAAKCKRDIGYLVDAVAADLPNGGNGSVINFAKAYFDKNGLPISDGLVGEEAQSVVAFAKAGDMMKKAITNQLYSKDLTILSGPAEYVGYETNQPIIPNLPSGNAATCIDVQANIDTLVSIATTVISDGDLDSLNDVPVSGDIPVFNYNQAVQEWQDNSILDLSNPDNVLYKFNAPDGGAIVPRGCSLIGYDLRRTIVRPLYVPDPADGSQERTSIFNLTGGCYLWQFTIKDGDLSNNSPLYDTTAGVGKVYYQKGNNTALAIPEYSHHKICIMTYADTTDLQIYYDKVARAFALFQPTIDDGDFLQLPQENRIVGPLSDTRSIVNIKVLGQTASGKSRIQVTTKTAHGYFKLQYVAIIDNGLNEGLNGTFKVTEVDDIDPKLFVYEVDLTPQQLGLDIDQDYTVPDVNISARVQAEIDSVESASPYVFNCSIRSTWGQCGMWADGSKATGFKSMVVAQYTGVSLQKDDRAFIRYDEFSNTWNQASLTDAFATTAYHTKGDAYWKDDWRNFHIRASDDSFIQCVSVFAVGFFDHFLMESGGDMSITNSNSNFGNTSLHSVGYKGFAFNQDKGGYITDIVPVKQVDTSAFNINDLKYYPLSNQATKAAGNTDKLYYSGDDVYSPFEKPATSIEGFRLGALTDDKVYLKLPKEGGGTNFFEETLTPTGFKKYSAALETLNPDGVSINNNAQDASNLIETNKAFIQNEAYKYIITKYPALQTNTDITIAKCERDIGYVVDAVIQDLRVGGNINSIQAAEGYYVGGTLSYIDGELNESIEAYDYVKNLCIAAMRNFDYVIRNCTTTIGSSIVDIGDTSGILVGMEVQQYEYNANNFTNGRLNRDTAAPLTISPQITGLVYVRRVLDSTKIEIGNTAPVLTTDANGILQASYGNAVVASSSGSSAVLHFQFPQTASGSDSNDILVGGYSDINPVRDSSVLQDTSVWGVDDDTYPECNDIKTLIQGYFTEFNLILNNGLTPLGGTEVDAHNLILANKDFIAAEAYARMLAIPGNENFATPTGDPQDCIDDVVAVLETIAYNIKYGGNDKVYDGAKLYVTQPNLLEGEREQSVQVYAEARDLAISVMRNESIQVVGTHGLTQVTDFAVLGDVSGLPGQYTSTVEGQSTDCGGVATNITNLIAIVAQAIGTPGNPGDLNGIPRTAPSFNVATRVEPVVDTANLAARATLFTINTGSGTSNPHYFETGTPVRLVPRIRDGVDPNTVDKRVIRLPKGFDTNTIYYVIAPGRTTQPEDYSDGVTYPGIFTNQNTTKLMLATTKENAAAGIYMYSPETESVDYDVEIDLYQYVLDDTYKLHQYVCNFPTGQTTVIETDVPHVFDVPGTEAHVQEIFFRTFGDNSELPQLPNGDVVNTNKFYYARYSTEKTFEVFETKASAVAGSPSITFANGFGQNFYVFANKRQSPVLFDPTRDDSALPEAQRETTTGQWYIQVKPNSDATTNIIARMQEIGDDLKDSRSKNVTFERLTDDRSALDRIYRLRYVIPKFADGVRDPLNGFVLKARTDTTRRLVPQKIVLNKTQSSLPDRALFEISVPLISGGTVQQALGIDTDDSSYNSAFTYDPYNSTSVKQITSDRTDSKVAFSIQSARTLDNGKLELTVFDLTITDDSVRNEQFITVKIAAPQGGNGQFRVNTAENNDLNKIFWNGFASGSGYVQGYFNPEGTDDHYLILKELEENNEERETVEYNPVVATTLYQPVLDSDNDPVFDANGNQELIYAKLLAKQDSVGSPNFSLSKSLKEDYLYSDKETNVFTMTPGDIITDDDGNDYEIESVEDIGEIEDTFYIFDVEEIKRRIPNQQEGIYYLTCVKGNISPYPTGAGVGENFRNFKFSQPIGQLYPLDYKNDPLWFQIRQDGTRDTTILDTPATVCAADNFIHGLVTTNDYKNSTTKEVVQELTANPALSRYTYVTNKIEAQSGNAASGSEDRLIPISGDSKFPTEQRLYVELRRPSIARSGNHTFEYLGFGPGNYSTGFPLRQEVVLEDIQDFYAQAKREDGGIVFYTGLNSNGDLYIGNRKINAITGEETFLERAELLSSEDDDEDVGGLVTTFELPVVFEQEITVDGDALFNNPVTINVDADEDNALTIESNVDEFLGGDITLDSGSWNRSTIASEGNIVLHQNQIFSAIYRLNPRGSQLLSGQDYSIRTHVEQGSDKPTNKTPHQTLTSVGEKVFFGPAEIQQNGQTVDNLKSRPIAGDIILKGEQVGKTGSLGWIFANFYNDVTSNIEEVDAMGGSLVRFNLVTGQTVGGNGIEVGSVVKFENLDGRFSNLNGLRTVVNVDKDGNGNYQTTSTWFEVNAPFTVTTSAADPTAIGSAGTGVVVSVGVNEWKEVGILGAEALRTNTDIYGKYALGVNTLARTEHSDYEEGFVSAATQPRATLDVVGNTFISGKQLSDTNYLLHSSESDRSFIEVDHALLVGGDSVTPDNSATFRVATTNGLQDDGNARIHPGGRLGVNVDVGSMYHTLTVVGDMRLTENALFEENLAVNGGSLTSTSSSFSLLSGNVTQLAFASNALTVNFANTVSATDTASTPQTFTFGSNAGKQVVNFGTSADEGTFNLHSKNTAYKSLINLGVISNLSTNLDRASVVKIGGAYNKVSTNLDTGSILKVYNRFVHLDGDLTLGTNITVGTGESSLRSQAGTVKLFDINTKRLEIGSAVSRMFLGAEGGFTTVNNSLTVKAATRLEGDTTLSGGLNSGEFEVIRGSFSTDAPAHDKGDIDDPNIDLFTRQIIDRRIDTDGAGYWGDVEYKVGSDPESYYLVFDAPSDTTAFVEGAYLLIDRSGLALSDPTRFLGTATSGGNQLTSVTDTTWVNTSTADLDINWVEIETPGVTFADGTRIAQLDVLSGNVITLNKSFMNPLPTGVTQIQLVGGESTQGPAPIGQEYSELLLIEELTNLNTVGGEDLRVKVKRAMNQRNADGTIILGTPSNLPSGATNSGYKFMRTDHPDNSPIIRYNLAEDVSFIDEVNGLPTSTSGTEGVDVNTGDFSGAVDVGDILRFTDSELALITAINTTSPQRLVVTDGNDESPVEQFVVDSTTGNTTILGTLDVNKSITLNGTTTTGSELLSTNNGDGTTTFSVDSADGTICFAGDLKAGGPQCDRLTTLAANGNTTIRGGNFKVTGDNVLNDRLILNNSSGSLSISGIANVNGTGESTFQGNLKVNGGNFVVNKIKDAYQDAAEWQAQTAYDIGDYFYYSSNIYEVTGVPASNPQSGTTPPVHESGNATNGNLTVTFKETRDEDQIFEIERSGAINFANQDGFFTPNGARKWQFVGAGEVDFSAEVNVNYFVSPSADLTIRLPQNPVTGDMVRIVDVGGNLTYNISLRMRAPNGVLVQGDNTNGNTPDLSATAYDGGELVVQTAHAAFGLIYLGNTNYDNTSTGAPPTALGWWLMEI